MNNQYLTILDEGKPVFLGKDQSSNELQITHLFNKEGELIEIKEEIILKWSGMNGYYVMFYPSFEESLSYANKRFKILKKGGLL